MSLSVDHPDHVHINLHENNLLPTTYVTLCDCAVYEHTSTYMKTTCGLLTSSRQGTA